MEEDAGPSFTHSTLATDPAAVERQITAWASADAVRRLTALGARSIQPEVHGSLVEAVLLLRWRESEALSTAVLEFALELVSAVPAFNKPVVNALVLAWLPPKPEPGNKLQPVPETTLPRVHETLRSILRVTPLAIRCAPGERTKNS